MNYMAYSTHLHTLANVAQGQPLVGSRAVMEMVKEKTVNNASTQK
jgi:hypothetical protein